MIEWSETNGGYVFILNNGKRYNINPVPKKKGKFNVYSPSGIILNYAPLTLEDAKKVAEDSIYMDYPEYKFEGQMHEWVKGAEIILKNGRITDEIKDLKYKAFVQGYLDMAEGSGYDETQLADKSLETYYHDGYYAYRKAKNID